MHSQEKDLNDAESNQKELEKNMEEIKQLFDDYYPIIAQNTMNLMDTSLSTSTIGPTITNENTHSNPVNSSQFINEISESTDLDQTCFFSSDITNNKNINEDNEEFFSDALEKIDSIQTNIEIGSQSSIIQTLSTANYTEQINGLSESYLNKETINQHSTQNSDANENYNDQLESLINQTNNLTQNEVECDGVVQINVDKEIQQFSYLELNVNLIEIEKQLPPISDEANSSLIDVEPNCMPDSSSKSGSSNLIVDTSQYSESNLTQPKNATENEINQNQENILPDQEEVFANENLNSNEILDENQINATTLETNASENVLVAEVIDCQFENNLQNRFNDIDSEDRFKPVDNEVIIEKESSSQENSENSSLELEKDILLKFGLESKSKIKKNDCKNITMRNNSSSSSNEVETVKTLDSDDADCVIAEINYSLTKEVQDGFVTKTNANSTKNTIQSKNLEEKKSTRSLNSQFTNIKPSTSKKCSLFLAHETLKKTKRKFVPNEISKVGPIEERSEIISCNQTNNNLNQFINNESEKIIMNNDRFDEFIYDQDDPNNSSRERKKKRFEEETIEFTPNFSPIEYEQFESSLSWQKHRDTSSASKKRSLIAKKKEKKTSVSPSGIDNTEKRYREIIVIKNVREITTFTFSELFDKKSNTVLHTDLESKRLRKEFVSEDTKNRLISAEIYLKESQILNNKLLSISKPSDGEKENLTDEQEIEEYQRERDRINLFRNQAKKSDSKKRLVLDTTSLQLMLNDDFTGIKSQKRPQTRMSDRSSSINSFSSGNVYKKRVNKVISTDECSSVERGDRRTRRSSSIGTVNSRSSSSVISRSSSAKSVKKEKKIFKKLPQLGQASLSTGCRSSIKITKKNSSIATARKKTTSSVISLKQSSRKAEANTKSANNRSSSQNSAKSKKFNEQDNNLEEGNEEILIKPQELRRSGRLVLPNKKLCTNSLTRSESNSNAPVAITRKEERKPSNNRRSSSFRGRTSTALPEKQKQKASFSDYKEPLIDFSTLKIKLNPFFAKSLVSKSTTNLSSKTVEVDLTSENYNSESSKRNSNALSDFITNFTNTIELENLEEKSNEFELINPNKQNLIKTSCFLNEKENAFVDQECICLSNETEDEEQLTHSNKGLMSTSISTSNKAFNPNLSMVSNLLSTESTNQLSTSAKKFRMRYPVVSLSRISNEEFDRFHLSSNESEAVENTSLIAPSPLLMPSIIKKKTTRQKQLSCDYLKKFNLKECFIKLVKLDSKLTASLLEKMNEKSNLPCTKKKEQFRVTRNSTRQNSNSSSSKRKKLTISELLNEKEIIRQEENRIIDMNINHMMVYEDAEGSKNFISASYCTQNKSDDKYENENDLFIEDASFSDNVDQSNNLSSLNINKKNKSPVKETNRYFDTSLNEDNSNLQSRAKAKLVFNINDKVFAFNKADGWFYPCIIKKIKKVNILDKINKEQIEEIYLYECFCLRSAQEEEQRSMNKSKEHLAFKLLDSHQLIKYNDLKRNDDISVLNEMLGAYLTQTFIEYSLTEESINQNSDINDFQADNLFITYMHHTGEIKRCKFNLIAMNKNQAEKILQRNSTNQN